MIFSLVLDAFLGLQESVAISTITTSITVALLLSAGALVGVWRLKDGKQVAEMQEKEKAG